MVDGRRRGRSGDELSGRSRRILVRATLCVAILVPVALSAAAVAFASPVTITGFTGSIGRATDYPYCTGSTIIISGSGFVSQGAVTGVTIGGVPAANIIVGSDNVIDALVGPGATTGTVVVSNGSGPTTAPGTLTIYPCVSGPATSKPLVTSIPAKVHGGKKIQILGDGFVGTSAVTVGGVAATYAIPSGVNMYVIIPASAPKGDVKVAITNTAGTTTVTTDKVS